MSRMNDLVLYKSKNFQGSMCDLYRDINNDIFMTREQMGIALEYSDPMTAIGKIHDRHKERLDKYSFTTLVNGRNTYLYEARGIYEICRWSRQSNANAFMDWVWNLLEGLRKGELILLQQKLEEQQPKIEFYNQVINTRSNFTMLQVAKVLKLKGRNKMFAFLRSEDILMSKKERHNIPRQQFIDAGYFLVIIKSMYIKGEIVDIPVTLVTPKGIQYILKRWNKKNVNLLENKVN